MKREGRQHGMVRTYRILPDLLNQTTNTLRFVNRIDTPPTAGLFTKVSNKPTNHSKSSGLSNSNSKAKKSKRRNNNKYRAVLIDDVHFTGASASAILSKFEDATVYDEEHPDGYGDNGSLSGSVYEIEVNYLTDEIYYSEADEVEEDVHPLKAVEQIDLLTTTVEQMDPSVVANGEIEDGEIIVDEDGCSVTIGEVVVLFEKVAYDEDDWCFVGADDQF